MHTHTHTLQTCPSQCESELVWGKIVYSSLHVLGQGWLALLTYSKNFLGLNPVWGLACCPCGFLRQSKKHGVRLLVILNQLGRCEWLSVYIRQLSDRLTDWRRAQGVTCLLPYDSWNRF